MASLLHKSTFGQFVFWDSELESLNKIKEQDAHHLVGQAKRCNTKIRLKAVKSSIFGRFSNFAKCRSEAAGDVISGVGP